MVLWWVYYFIKTHLKKASSGCNIYLAGVCFLEDLYELSVLNYQPICTKWKSLPSAKLTKYDWFRTVECVSLMLRKMKNFFRGSHSKSNYLLANAFFLHTGKDNFLLCCERNCHSPDWVHAQHAREKWENGNESIKHHQKQQQHIITFLTSAREK